MYVWSRTGQDDQYGPTEGMRKMNKQNQFKIGHAEQTGPIEEMDKLNNLGQLKSWNLADKLKSLTSRTN